MALASPGGNMATTQHHMIAELQSANAALRLQLDQRGAERDAALAREAALAEVLDIINRSPGNLAPVFDAILEKAHSLCDAAMGALVLYDGECFRAVASHGFPEQHAALIRQPYRPNSHHLPLLRGERFIHVPDLRVVGTSDHEVFRNLVQNTGARALLIVPLRKDGSLLGNITAYRFEVRPYSDKEIALLENFAAQAVIAMENARLITEQREALEQQTATAEVLQVINASPADLGPVFDTILEKATSLCDAPRGILWQYDGEAFRPAAVRGATDAFASFLRNPGGGFSTRSLASIIRGDAHVHELDLKDTETYRRDPLNRALVDLGGARTALLVPLLKDGVLLGAIRLYRAEVRPFTDRQIALLQSFAAQAVIAMENARLLEELRASTDELTQRQAELRVTFENMGDGVAMFDETPRLVAWNRKFQGILDLPDGVLAERLTFPDYVRYLVERGEYGAAADPDAQIQWYRENADHHYAYKRTRPDGRVIEVRHNPVAGGGFVLIYADITERKTNEAEIRAARDAAEEASRTIEAAFRDLKAAQANLIQAEKMASLGQLTAGIAHEIKNPLNFVNNFAILSVELLTELKEAIAKALGLLDDDQRDDVEEAIGLLTGNLEKITEHGQRADGIVKSMLEHSRGVSGERQLVDVNSLAEEALNLAYHGARARDQSFHITLERHFGHGIGAIELNPQDITRALLNLINNGFYAASKRAQSEVAPSFEPTLRITTRDLGDAVDIQVRDNGTGIPADIRDKLFQPFFTTKPTGEGTGLGLSITYDIVTKAHGGSIAVDSEVGGYSEFTIRLPRKP